MPNTMKQDDDLNLTIAEPDDGKEASKGINALMTNKLFIVALVLVLIAGGATVWTIKKKPSEKAVKEEPAPEIHKVVRKQVFFTDIVDLGVFEVSLGDQGGELALHVGIRIEASSQAVKDEILRRAVQVKSAVHGVLGIKTLNELIGVDGKIMVKNELVTALNRMLETGKSKNVYFYEFVIR